uniref:TLDc domain-containing protein n=1 Tax=Heterorhabditis bacteriophora TaxID=37862 RepID=A0A1I7W8T6_HETBA
MSQLLEEKQSVAQEKYQETTQKLIYNDLIGRTPCDKSRSTTVLSEFVQVHQNDSSCQVTTSHLDTTTCGTQKQCIFVPTGCQVIFVNVRLPYKIVSFPFSTNNSPGNNYLAVGFSQDDLMVYKICHLGDDYVTHCAFPETGQPEVHVTRNFGKSNSPPSEEKEMEVEKEYLHMVHAHKEEHDMYCHFRQNSSKAKLQFYPDLDNKFQIFLVRGMTRKPNSIGIHSLDPSSPDFPFISESKINIRQKKNIPQATDANLSSTLNISDSLPNENHETKKPLLSKEIQRIIMRTQVDHKKRKEFSNMVSAIRNNVLPWPSGSRRGVGCGGPGVGPVLIFSY